MAGTADVMVYMMQKNEGLLLDNWLRHYGRLFGPANLTVLDNDSDDLLTRRLLADAVANGSRVSYAFRTHDDFRNKGDIIRGLAEDDMRRRRFDFVLPVDCDELLAVFTDGTISTHERDVHAELLSYRGCECALRLELSLMNCPGEPGWFASDEHFVKSLVPSLPIGQSDYGFHSWLPRDAPWYRGTRLAYLHYHNPELRKAREKARWKLHGRLDIGDAEALRCYNGPGAHLTPFLLMGEGEYVTRYRGRLRLCLDGETVWFRYPDSEQPVLWDPHRYDAAYPGLRENYAHGLLHHFVRSGFYEGRRL
ncbi:MAG: glycosyltransferase family 2 protein [Gluconacetobacter diazotrophicus]|nr:glycosyltransferase family 2 protein [Gluconacetobacter diazotrophicus]